MLFELIAMPIIVFGPNSGLLMQQTKTLSSIGTTIFSESVKEIEINLLTKPTGM